MNHDTRMSLANFISQGRRVLGQRFQVDVLWNIASLGVMGVCGIALNLLVGLYYDAATLGVFNQVFAAYILLSQFAVGGVHYSVLKHIVPVQHERTKAATVILSGLAASTVLAAIATAVFVLGRGFVGNLLHSEDVATGMLWAAPGLFCFAINKVLLSALNGLGRMRIFAVLQALRPVLMIAAFAVAAAMRMPGTTLPVVFSVAEALILLLTIVPLRRFLFHRPAGMTPWMREHLVFGSKSFLGGVLVELNTRVDVLMLGYFTSDVVVGIYSYAAILAEGVFQLLIVLRNNYNPLIARLLHEGDISGLERMARKGVKVTYALMTATAIIAVGVYYLAAQWFPNPQSAQELQASWPLFAVLMAGIVAGSGYVPFSFTVLLAGRPGLHTLLMTAVVVGNFIGNAALIPLWGAIGSAIATAVSFVLFAALIRIMTRSVTGASL
jgi:O-antigen/teichoic acid export membrane protein